jgi:predicted RNase H-like HicB family nuclease
MHIRIDIEQTKDDEWVAETVDLPGVVAYGYSRTSAYKTAQVLALRTLADLIEAGETRCRSISVSLLDS